MNDLTSQIQADELSDNGERFANPMTLEDVDKWAESVLNQAKPAETPAERIEKRRRRLGEDSAVLKPYLGFGSIEELRADTERLFGDMLAIDKSKLPGCYHSIGKRDNVSLNELLEFSRS